MPIDPVTGILIAVDALIQLQKAATQISAMIERARAENRDITDAELADLKAARDAAIARLYPAA